MLGVPVKLSDTPGAVRTPPPTARASIPMRCCTDLGLSADAIAELRAQKVI